MFLGSVFIIAGISKIFSPHRFAEEIKGLIPFSDNASLGIAFTLPVIELLLGFFLIAGWHQRLTSIIAVTLLTMFSAVAVVAISVGTTVSCGCFGALFEERADYVLLLRNGFLLGLAAILYSQYVHAQKTPQQTN